MGLDMYLEARKYVSKFDYSDNDRKQTNEYSEIAKTAPEGFDKYADFSGIYVSYPVGYWRKANAIHGWFVENVQGGVDDCNPHYVDRNQLVQLREACESVLRVPANIGGRLEDTASEVGLLPTRGFFFGSYEIDDWYMSDLEHTIEIIDHVLEIFPEGENSWNVSFYYTSSW